ncbi:MAG: NAD-dependent epimerase/dehydratase family protein [Verrucomicrobia bacterium]|nr:NAD-dependent epimerase/dehydratase family protein [Verrucomicrobiota bacterium]
MKRVLITGIAGFIGSNLAMRLQEEGDFEIIGIDNLSAGLPEQIPQGIEFHRLDIRSDRIYPLFKNVDFVFHLAGKNCIADCQADPVETADINVRGSVNVFEAAKQANVKKVIYAESSSIYEGSSILPTPECEAKPNSFYATSKWASMGFAEAYQRYSDMKFTALRYFCVYGPAQDYRRTIPPVMSAFIIHLLQGKRPTIYGDGEKRRDFVFVDDVNDFHLLCMTHPGTDGKVFNLGSGTNHSVNEIFKEVAKLLHSDLEPIYKENLPGEAQDTLGCIEEAKKVGWIPKTRLEEGLKRSIEFIRERVL